MGKYNNKLTIAKTSQPKTTPQTRQTRYRTCQFRIFQITALRSSKKTLRLRDEFIINSEIGGEKAQEVRSQIGLESGLMARCRPLEMVDSDLVLFLHSWVQVLKDHILFHLFTADGLLNLLSLLHHEVYNS